MHAREVLLMIYNRYNAPGKRLLKVSGIFMIVFGAATFGMLVGGILGLIGLFDFPEQNVKRISLFMLGFGLVGILQLITGIVGVKNCNKMEKAKACFVWGIIAAISALIGTLISFAIEAEHSWSNLAEHQNIYLFLIIPSIPYLIGAARNRTL